MLTGTNVVSRDRMLRSGRLLCVGVASFGRLARVMAKELKKHILIERSTCASGPLDVDLRFVWTTFNVWSNVEMWPSPANGSRIYMPYARPVDLTLIGERVRSW